MRVSVIGLGRIGIHLAEHILKAGHETVVWNRSPGPAESLAAKGAKRAETLEEAFQSDIVLSILFDDTAVRQCLLDPDLLAKMPKETLHICMSTISPDLAGELQLASKNIGFNYLSVPFFGRPEAAKAAKLNMIAAGKRDLISRAEPILALFGKIWRMGDEPSQANLAKIAGNFMITCAVQAMAEASVTMSSAGADPETFLKMMTQSIFDAPIYRTYAPSIAGTDPLPDLGIAIMEKDVGLMIESATRYGISPAFGMALMTQMAKVHKAGQEQKDMSVSLPFVLKQAN